MQLEITAEERALLQRILENALAEMRVEVRRTSTPRYHDDMQAEAQRLQQLVEKLQSLAP